MKDQIKLFSVSLCMKDTIYTSQEQSGVVKPVVTILGQLQPL